MNISNLSFLDLTNNVVRVAKTDINIFNNPSKTPVGFNIIDDNYVMILTSTSNNNQSLFKR